MSLVINLQENTFYSIDDIISIADKKITDNYYILEMIEGWSTESASEEKKRMVSSDFDFVLETFGNEVEKFMEDPGNKSGLKYEFSNAGIKASEHNLPLCGQGNMSFNAYCDGDLGKLSPQFPRSHPTREIDKSISSPEDHTADHYFMVTIHSANGKREMDAFKKFVSEYLLVNNKIQ